MSNANVKFDVFDEFVTTIDINTQLKELLGHSMSSGLDKLKQFANSSARRKLEELKGFVDATELNAFLRLAFNGEDPTIDVEQGVRSLDFKLKKDKETGITEVQSSEKRGLSFCTSLKKLADVVTARIRAFNKKRSESPFSILQENLDEVKVYIFKKGCTLPEGLAFVNDKPGHASLVVTRNMLMEILIKKLKEVEGMLEYLMTIKVES